MKPDSGEGLGALINDLSRTWRLRLDQRLRPLGLSQVQWRVLLLLARERKQLVQRDIAERIGIEGPTLAQLLDRMARRGWIVRRASAADRRCKTVHLTPKARGIVQKIRRITRAFRHELLAAISQEDLQTCRRILTALLQRAEELR
jgi:MarR family transcriptional regulator for hemolysin